MYKPNQRQVRVEILAVAGWVSGTVHVPAKSSLVATLAKKGEFLPLTDVTTGAAAEPLKFLALRRQAIILAIAAPDDVDLRASYQSAAQVAARVRCFLSDATLEGTITMLKGLRVSDQLEANTGFLALADCVVTMDDGTIHPGLEHVLLNVGHVFAVTELEPAKEQETLELVGASSLPAKR